VDYVLLLRATKQPVALLPINAGISNWGYRDQRIFHSKKRKRRIRPGSKEWKIRVTKHYHRLNAILQKLSRERGYNNEAFVEEILRIFETDGIIKAYQATQHWDKADRQGVDFIVTKIDGSRIGIQVKSSLRYAQKFQKLKEKRTLFNGENKLRITIHIIVVKTEYYVNSRPLYEELVNIIQSD
jgi:hypothetical protein